MSTMKRREILSPGTFLSSELPLESGSGGAAPLRAGVGGHGAGSPSRGSEGLGQTFVGVSEVREEEARLSGLLSI